MLVILVPSENYINLTNIVLTGYYLRLIHCKLFANCTTGVKEI